MTYKRYSRIGLDRIVICGVDIIEINIDNIMSLHNRAIAHQGKTVGVLKIEGGELKIKIALPLLFYIHNGYNTSRKEELETVTEILEREVGNLGVKICLKDSRVASLEINQNYKISNDPSSFMDLLINAQRRKTKPTVTYGIKEVFGESNSGAETVMFKVGKKYKIKVYLKSLQLREAGFYIDDEILRMELVLYAEMIKYYLDDNKLSTVLDNMDKLEEVYKKVMKKYMYDRIDEYLEHLNNEIKDKIKDGETPSKIVHSLRNDIHDIDVLKRAYTEYYKENKMKNQASTVVKRATKKECLNNNTLELFQCLKNI